MVKGKAFVIAIVTLLLGFLGVFFLRPVIAPAPQAIRLSGPSPTASVTTEARGTEFFVAHVDEAKRVVAGCRDGSVRAAECATAVEAMIKIDAAERRNKFLGN